MIHRAAAGAAAHHVDMVLLHKGTVDLRLGVLVLAHHDGVVVLPQQQIVSLGAVAQDIFLKRQIVIRVLGVGLKILYGFFHGCSSGLRCLSGTTKNPTRLGGIFGAEGGI